MPGRMAEWAAGSTGMHMADKAYINSPGAVMLTRRQAYGGGKGVQMPVGLRCVIHNKS